MKNLHTENTYLNKNIIISVPLIAVMLTGCDDNINSVKSTVYGSFNTTLTVGDAFKTRTDCIDGKWGEDKDNRDRIIVSYRCDLPEKYLDFYNKKQIEEVSAFYLSSENTINNRLKAAKNNLTNYKTMESFLEEKNDDMIELISKITKYQDTYGKYSADGLFHEPSELSEVTSISDKKENNRNLNKNNFCGVIFIEDEHNDKNINTERCDLLFDIHNKYISITNKSNLSNDDIFKNIDFVIMKSIPSTSFGNSDYGPETSTEVRIKKSIKEYNSYHDESLKRFRGAIATTEKNIVVYNKILENIKDYRKKLERNISLKEAMSTTRWFVTKSGGVELIDSYLTFNVDGNDYKYLFQNPMTAIEIAYHDFNNDQIPSLYINSMEKYFGKLKHSLKYDTIKCEGQEDCQRYLLTTGAVLSWQ